MVKMSSDVQAPVPTCLCCGRRWRLPQKQSLPGVDFFPLVSHEAAIDLLQGADELFNLVDVQHVQPVKNDGHLHGAESVQEVGIVPGERAEPSTVFVIAAEHKLHDLVTGV